MSKCVRLFRQSDVQLVQRQNYIIGRERGCKPLYLVDVISKVLYDYFAVTSYP